MSNDSIRLIDQYGLPILQGDRLDEPVIPHPLSFGSILNTIAKTYSYRWDEALRHLPQNALAMRRDAYIKSLLQERKMPTINRSWQLKADDPKDPRQKEAVQLLTRCVKQTRRWRRFLAYLMEAIWYGRYGSQATWVQRPIGNGRRAWVIGKHKPVNGDKIQYAWDDTPVVFINSSGSGRYPPEFVVHTDRVPGLRLAKQNWRDQFIIHTHEVDDADYFEGEMAGAVHGVGLRNSIYWAWWLRDEMLSWAVDFMKKVGTLGLLVFWYELGNKAAKSEAELNAKRASKDTALVMGRPSGKESATWGVDHFAAQYGGVEALQRMIQDYFEHHMERLIVGQTLSAGTEGGGLGGTGVAKLHEDTKFQLLQFDADNLAETLTDDLIGPMLRLNVPGADFGVRFEFNVESPENVDKMEAVSKAVAMGVTFKMDEIRELTGMSKPEEGDETIGGGAKGQSDKAKRKGEEYAETADREDRPSGQATDSVAYIRDAAFEALHPRDAHGKFAEKPRAEEELVSAVAEQPPPAKEQPPAKKQPAAELTEDATASEYKTAAEQMLGNFPATAQGLIDRNSKITKLYAAMFLLKPKTYYWMGMGAAASSEVGVAMAAAANPANPLLKAADLNMLAEGNLAVFKDLYWQFLVFQHEGFAGIERLKGDFPTLAHDGWELINKGLQQGGEKGNKFICEGNLKLLEYEQKDVLQPIWRKHADSAVRMSAYAGSPIPPSPRNDPLNVKFRTAVPNGNIGNVDDRWKWITTNVVPSYRNWLEKDSANALLWEKTWKDNGTTAALVVPAP